MSVLTPTGTCPHCWLTASLPVRFHQKDVNVIISCDLTTQCFLLIGPQSFYLSGVSPSYGPFFFSIFSTRLRLFLYPCSAVPFPLHLLTLPHQSVLTPTPHVLLREGELTRPTENRERCIRDFITLLWRLPVCGPESVHSLRLLGK